MGKSTSILNETIERMSTGYKVNHAKDNAANYSISTNMTTKIGAYEVAESNTMMGLDMVNTASESLSLIEDKLMRLRALATQAKNGTYGAQSLEAINTEANALTDEIERLYKTAEYNGVKLFNNKEITFDKNMCVSMVDDFITGETYYISTSTDLLKLQNLVNDGKGTLGVNFELVNDINMQDFDFRGIGLSSNTAFRGKFNGNGYTIYNLTIKTDEIRSGLFGVANDGAEIKSLTLLNCNIQGYDYVAGLVGYGRNIKLENCKVQGIIRSSHDAVGGLVGFLMNSYVNDCVTDVDIMNNNLVGYGNAYGGLIGSATDCEISRCYSISNIKGSAHLGGLIGSVTSSVINNSYAYSNINGSHRIGGLIGGLHDNNTLNNCYSISKIIGTLRDYGSFVGYSTGNSSGVNNYCNIDATSSIVGNGTFNNITALTEEEIVSTENLKSMGFSTENNWTIKDNKPISKQFEVLSKCTRYQIGISNNKNSTLEIITKVVLFDLDILRGIGDYNRDYISIVDKILNTISDKQTELGAAQNRLESALDEISTQYENLASSRSTLRDADMAELSSTYVQQQILQQAAATLMSSANQSPAIALQLI